jgi:DNA-binding MarR family transcriptional regulator
VDETNEIRDLRETIRYIGRALEKLEKSGASCCDTTVGQYHAIVEIRRAGEISLSDLAEILNLDVSAMSRRVDSLITKGLAEKYIYSGDRRSVKIKLTEEGQKFYKKTELNMDLYFKKVVESISENKRYQVMDGLQILLEALRKINVVKEKKGIITDFDGKKKPKEKYSSVSKKTKNRKVMPSSQVISY